MKVFDIENQCTYLVSEDCGAWKPKPEQIVKKIQWGRVSP
jgi:hypothetical protein